MKKQTFNYKSIPSVIWGEESTHVLLVVHGFMSHKEDRFTRKCAEVCDEKGIQVFSFDLPEHGGRNQQEPELTIQQAIIEMKSIMEYLQSKYSKISLGACSLGAYYSLLAYADVPIQNCILLSPVVDLIELTNGMLDNDKKTLDDLRKNPILVLSDGMVVKLQDYEYLIQHPIINWNIPTSILYGLHDALIPITSIQSFSLKYNCEVIYSKHSEHYFHTEDDMIQVKNWINQIF